MPGPDYVRMQDIERRYRAKSGLSDRRDYSIFYGPLAKCGFLMLNKNPGGSAENFRIVDVMAGQHEFIEGRESGATTRNTARYLMQALGTNDPESLRPLQFCNVGFRRPGTRGGSVDRDAREAQAFVAEIIRYVEPDLILFGGDPTLHSFSKIHGAQAVEVPDTRKTGQVGSIAAAPLFCRYHLTLPYYRSVDAWSILHPSLYRGDVAGWVTEQLGPPLRDAVRKAGR